MKQLYILFSVVLLTVVKASSNKNAVIRYEPSKAKIPGPIRDIKYSIKKEKVIFDWTAPATNKTFFVNGYEIMRRIRNEKKKWTPYLNVTFPNNKTVTYTLDKLKKDTGFDVYITPYQIKLGRKQYWPWTRIYSGASGLIGSTILTSILAFVVTKIDIFGKF